MGFFDRFKRSETPDVPVAQPIAISSADVEAVLDRYFVRLERLERAKKKRLIDEAMSVSRSVVNDLDKTIAAWGSSAVTTWQPDPVPDGYVWLPPSLPAVETICQMAPAIGDEEALKHLHETILRLPALRAHEDAVRLAFDDHAMGSALLSHVGSNPGVKQAGLAKQLGFDGHRLRSVIYWMAELGVLHRTKAGSTYSLSIPGDESTTESGPDASTQVPTQAEALASTSGSLQSRDTGVRPAPDRSRQPGPRQMPVAPPRAAIDSCDAGDFVTIDFETATAERASACAVAVAIVDCGTIVAEKSWLIRPPENRYESFNSMLHGIGPEDTHDAPGFLEVMSEVVNVIGDRPVLAHYAPFDLGVLRSSYAEAGVPWPAMTVGCTVILSRRCWPGLASYSLPLVADFLGLDTFTHHDATADARACADIARALMVETSTGQLADAAEAIGVRFGRLDPTTYNPCLAEAQSIRSTLVPPDPADLDPEHPFAEAGVAFTGALMSMPRRDAAQLVVNAGGEFSTNVSKKTNYLVFGQQDFTRFVDGESSAKTKKALALVNDGHPLQIIEEAEFLRML